LILSDADKQRFAGGWQFVLSISKMFPFCHLSCVATAVPATNFFDTCDFEQKFVLFITSAEGIVPRFSARAMPSALCAYSHRR
jgi:hypothetical protein